MIERRPLPIREQTKDLIHADMVSAHGMLREALSVVDSLAFDEGRITAGRLRAVSMRAMEVQRLTSSWADEIEEECC